MEASNVKAMREALEKIAAMEVPHNFQCERSDIADACYDLTRAIKKAHSALAAPPRNCDVGTAEEQAERFYAFCRQHRAFDAGCSANCPCDKEHDINHCQSAWAQMPYVAKEGDAE